jgi:hypothetical protein
MTAAAPADGARAGSDTLYTAALCAGGAALLGFAAFATQVIAIFGYAVFIPALALSGLITVAATHCVARIRPGRALAIVLAFALAMRLALVGIAPLLSTDIYRYVWDGRVQAAGINPYRYVPADPALSALRDSAIYPHINRADYAITAYLPLAQMFYLAVTRLSESIVAMRLALVGCEAVIVALLIALLRRLRRNPAEVVAYAWHPLALFEIANNGHVEALMVALAIGGVALLLASRRIAGAFVMGLAAVVKPYAVFLLPAFWRVAGWRRWDWRAPLAAIGAAALCYLPYLGVGRGVLGFLGQGYLGEEGITSGEGIWIVALLQEAGIRWAGLAALYAAVAAVIMIWLGVRVARRHDRTPAQTIGDLVLLAIVGLFLMSPNYAWYFLLLVPFLALGAGAPVWALTLGAVLMYRPLLLPANDLAWKTLATLPFLLALAATRGRLWRSAAR